MIYSCREALSANLTAAGQGALSLLPICHRLSLGLFRTGTTYFGQNGYSLKLHGLEKGGLKSPSNPSGRSWVRVVVSWKKNTT